MAELALTARPRDLLGKQVARLRRAGVVPAVVYGPAVSGPRSIELDLREFDSIYRRAGLTKLVSLTIDDGPAQAVFIRDIQYNMLKRRVDHIDFYAARMDIETTVTVSVVLVGDAPIAARGDAVLTQVLTSVTVRAMPQAIPAHLEIDASGIKTIDDDVRVADLRLPAGVTIVDNPEAIIISVTQVRQAEEPAVAPVEVAAPAEIVVEAEASAATEPAAEPEER